jgi:O-antigen/teichoic acid export membrane protein
VSEPARNAEAEQGSPVAALLGRGSIYTVATAAQLSAGLLVLPFLTRLLDPAELGVVAIATVILYVISVVGPLGLPFAAMRAYFRDDQGPAAARQLLRRCIGISVLIALVADLTGPLWSDIFSNVGFSTALELAVWAGVPTAALACAQAILRAEDRAGRFVITTVIATAGAQLLGVGLLLAVDGDATAYVAGLLIGLVVAATLACAWAGIARSDDPRPSPGLTVAALRIGVPSVPHSLAIYLLAAGDRIIVESLEGANAVGRYQVAYQIGAVVLAIVAAFNNAWDPIVFGEREERRWHTLAETRKVLYRIATALLAAVALSAPLLLVIAAPSGYDPDGLVAVTALIAASAVPMVSYMASFHVLIWEARTGVLVWAAPLAAVANVALCYALIPVWELTGAAVATVIGYCVLALITRWRAGRLAQVPGGPGPFLVAAAVTGAVVAVSILLPTEDVWLAIRGAMGVAVGVATLAYGVREVRRPHSPAPEPER